MRRHTPPNESCFKIRLRRSHVRQNVGFSLVGPRSGERGYGFEIGSTHRRSGITLTQMLVVIALTSIITTAAISIIITMLRLEGRTMQVWMTQQTLLQLGDDFREDAHAAQSAEISTQNRTTTLIFRSGVSDTKSVAYVATESQVIRRETDGEKLLRTETYRLPEGEVLFGGISFGVESLRLSLGQSVRLTCRRPNVEAINRRTPAPRHDEHVIAVLGRDHRFEKP